MTVIKADKDLQPVLTSGKDFEAVDGVEEVEQWIRIQAKDRLYNIISKYQNEDIPNKIKLTLSRLARESSYIESVENISVTRLSSVSDSKDNGYRVNIKYNGSEEYQTILDSV